MIFSYFSIFSKFKHLKVTENQANHVYSIRYIFGCRKNLISGDLMQKTPSESLKNLLLGV